MEFGKRKLKMTKSAIAARRAYRLRTRGSPKRRRRKSPVRRCKSPKVNRVYKGCPGSRTCGETEKYIDMLEGRVTVNSQKANRLERELQDLKSKDIDDAKKLAAVKKLQKSIRSRNEKRSKLAEDAEKEFDAYSEVWGSSFGMATVCPPGYRPNKRYRAKRSQRQCLKGLPKKTLGELQAIARANDVSIYRRRKDDNGFTRTPLSVRALKYRLTKMKVAHFGMATVCPPGYSPNSNWQRKRGQRQCLKNKKASVKKAKPTLKQLQALARANDVSIYRRRKDDNGFTRTPLTVKALKLRLTKLKVPYK